MRNNIFRINANTKIIFYPEQISVYFLWWHEWKWHNFDLPNLFWYRYEYRYLKCKKDQWGQKGTQEVHWGVIKLFWLLSDFPRDITQKAGKNVIACINTSTRTSCESLECKHRHKHKHEAIVLSLLTRNLAFHWFTLEHNNLIFFCVCLCSSMNQPYLYVWIYQLCSSVNQLNMSRSKCSLR